MNPFCPGRDADGAVVERCSNGNTHIHWRGFLIIWEER